jgi:hypothetical protein
MYRITVEKETTKTVMTTAAWQIIARRKISGEEVDLLEADERKYCKPNGDGSFTYEEWGYPPKQETEKEVTVIIYEQRVESVDMGKLIASINNLQLAQPVPSSVSTSPMLPPHLVPHQAPVA